LGEPRLSRGPVLLWLTFILFNILFNIVYESNLSEITELKCTSLIKIIIKGENFKWHLEAFASELFIYI